MYSFTLPFLLLHTHLCLTLSLPVSLPLHASCSSHLFLFHPLSVIGCVLVITLSLPLPHHLSLTLSMLSPLSQSTSGSGQVGLLPQGVRLLRSPALLPASSDAFTFPHSTCPPEHSLMVEDVGTPKVSKHKPYPQPLLLGYSNSSQP